MMRGPPKTGWCAICQGRGEHDDGGTLLAGRVVCATCRGTGFVEYIPFNGKEEAEQAERAFLRRRLEEAKRRHMERVLEHCERQELAEQEHERLRQKVEGAKLDD